MEPIIAVEPQTPLQTGPQPNLDAFPKDALFQILCVPVVQDGTVPLGGFSLISVAENSTIAVRKILVWFKEAFPQHGIKGVDVLRLERIFAPPDTLVIS